MATLYASGATWNTASNWGTTSGASDGTVPTSADDVIFDVNSISMAIDVNASCLSIDSTGFTNTLTQNATFTLTVGSGGLLWAAGTFAGGDSKITVNNFTQTGGTFTSTSGTLEYTNYLIKFTVSGGTFNHNSGTVEGTGASNSIDASGVTFSTVIMDNSNGSASWSFVANCTITTLLHIKSGAPGGTATVAIEGDFRLDGGTSVVTPGTGTFEFTGAGAQKLYVDEAGGTGETSRIKINKPSGTLTVKDTIRLKSNGGNVWEWVQGTVDMTTSSINLINFSSTIADSNTDFYDMVINHHNPATNLTITGDCKVTNSLTFQGINNISGDDFILSGNLVSTDASVGGTSGITFNGGSDSTIDLSGPSDIPNGLLTIAKTGSAIVRQLSDVDVSATGQDMTINSGAVFCTNGFDLTVNDVLTNNGHLRAIPGDTVTYGSLVGNAIVVAQCPGTITKSIGTTGRDYSTVTLWEADLDAEAFYISGDDAVGEMHKDSIYNESVVINGGGTIGLASIKLTAPPSERHNGTAGSGVRFVMSTDFKEISATVDNVTFEWIEVDNNGKHGAFSMRLDGDNSIIRNCIIHGGSSTTATIKGIECRFNCSIPRIYNNIIYDISCNTAGAEAAIGIDIGSGGTEIAYVYNNTVYGIVKDGGTGDGIGIRAGLDTGGVKEFYNNISMGVSGTSSGTIADFELDASALQNYNMSEDASAVGTNSLTSKTPSDQFVSITGGSEDFHVKKGADSLNAGVSLIPEIYRDIVGTVRGTAGGVEIGAFESVLDSSLFNKTTGGLTGKVATVIH